jgi:cytochrome o ubiquinol oxidase operon protein cyoD
MKKHTLALYSIGFLFSLLLTLAAYIVVQVHVSSAHSIISHEFLISTILVLAFIQLGVQLFFFLHLDFGNSGNRWKLGIFISTFALVLLVVVGSLWIMDHLNYNMTPAQIDQYMQDQQGGF